jgi:hypothetical protein
MGRHDSTAQGAGAQGMKPAPPPAFRFLAMQAVRAAAGAALFTLTAFAMPARAQDAASPCAASTPDAASPAYPLKVSASKRYLVDQNNVPFLMAGDAPQMMVSNLTPAEAKRFVANRQKYGINTLWIHVLCMFSDACKDDASTVDGIAPFLTAGDLSAPNPAYFERVDEMLRIAAAHGMAVLLDPIETSRWLPVLRANGLAKATAYGEFLGKRYKDYPNILWMHGNDFQSWQDKTDDALVQAVAKGIRSADKNHLHTVELHYLTSGSLDDPSWEPLIDFDLAYTYFPAYAQVLTEYNRPDFKPVIMAEGSYEFEQGSEGSPSSLRRQEYWTMLSGAAGQVYGSLYTWRLPKDWEANLDTPGAVQFGYMKNFFAPRKWQDLVPDQSHTVVTAGYDGFSGFIGKASAWIGKDLAFSEPGFPRKVLDRIRRTTGYGYTATNTYATAASTPDGSLVAVYMPTARTVTVDMSKLSGPAVARWYDPASGDYLSAAPSPLPSKGEKTFTPPGENSAGDSDWVLVIETSPADNCAN